MCLCRGRGVREGGRQAPIADRGRGGGDRRWRGHRPQLVYSLLVYQLVYSLLVYQLVYSLLVYQPVYSRLVYTPNTYAPTRILPRTLRTHTHHQNLRVRQPHRVRELVTWPVQSHPDEYLCQILGLNGNCFTPGSY